MKRKRPALDGWSVGVGALVIAVVAYLFWNGWDSAGLTGVISIALILVVGWVVWTDKRLH